jgi:hypothetical protein
VRRRSPEERLRATGRALDEDVPAGQRGDEKELDRAVLADHDLRNLSLRPLAQVDEILVRRLDDECHSDLPQLLFPWGKE